jgi:hypothetical protein
MSLNMASRPSGKLERTWHVRREPRAIVDAMRFAELAVPYCDAECQRATSMAIAELAENLLKYAPAEGRDAGTIAIVIKDGVVRLRVMNVADRAEDARQARETINRLASVPNIAELYRQRLAELLKNPGLPRAQLGLLRIAFEGGFKLSCSYKPPSVEIVAERTCCGRR